MVFHFAQATQKWKNHRDQARLIFLEPLHQTPSHGIPLLSARARDSKVSLLAGYPSLINKGSPDTARLFWNKSCYFFIANFVLNIKLVAAAVSEPEVNEQGSRSNWYI